MQVIENWLKGNKNFYVGVAIYKSVGSDKNLLALLEKGESPHAVELLEKALAGQLAQRDTVIENHDAIEMPASNDAVLAAIKNEWMPLFQQMNFKRHQLQRYGNSNAPAHIGYRKKIAFEILNLEKQVNAIWAKRDYYIENKKLPEIKTGEEITIPDNPLEHAKLIESTARRIRDWRNKLTKQTSNAKAAGNLKKYKYTYKILTGKEYEEK